MALVVNGREKKNFGVLELSHMMCVEEQVHRFYMLPLTRNTKCFRVSWTYLERSNLSDLSICSVVSSMSL